MNKIAEKDKSLPQLVIETTDPRATVKKKKGKENFLGMMRADMSLKEAGLIGRQKTRLMERVFVDMLIPVRKLRLL